MTEGNDLGNLVRGLVDRDLAMDEQAWIRERAKLQQRLFVMDARSRRSRVVIVCGLVGLLMAYAVIGLAVHLDQRPSWLFAGGLFAAMLSALLIVVGSVGYFLFHGRNYAKARDDVREAQIVELTRKIAELSEKVDKLSN